MRLTVLGSGTNVHPTRAAAGYLVETDQLLLFDFGPRTLMNLIKVGADRHRVQHLFITHHHTDHFADFLPFFFDAVFHAKYVAPRPGLTIYGPRGTRRLFGTLVKVVPGFSTAPFPIDGDPSAAPAPTAVAPTRAGRKSATTLLVVVGVAALLLLGIGLVALVLAKRPNEAVATPGPVAPSTTLAATAPTAVPTTAPPPAVLGAVHVESQPAGATVTVDNQPRGVTPLDVPDLALGHHDVKVELKGYSPAAQGVELVAETPRAELKVTLARVAPAMTVADILSTPLGATVKVDGAAVGRTPLIDFKLKPGPHSVEVSKDGYETWSQTANAGGRKLFLDASLRQVARATPPPVNVPEAVDVNKIYAENEVDTPPKKLSGMTASYPSGRAPRLRAGDSVSVTLNYIVTETGQIGDLKVTESGGKAVDDEVLSALKEWKYAPGSKRGMNVKVRLVRKFTFKGG